MAYVLGFTCADGNVHGSTLAWDLADKYPSNKKLLDDFNVALESTYPIHKRKKSYRLRISNQVILSDIKKLGIVPNKKKILSFPNVPDEFLRDFVRGFLDGDGWITIRDRKNGVKEVSVGFSNGSLKFMQALVDKLDRYVILSNHNLRIRKRITPRGVETITYQLEYYSRNAFNLVRYLFDDLQVDDLFLKRKFNKQTEARRVYKQHSLKSKLFREKELEFGRSMRNLLEDFVIKNGFNGCQTAKILNVHSSTVYCWLEKTKVRIPAVRGLKE